MTAATRVAPHDRHLVGPDGDVRVVHVRGHRREVPAWLFETGPLPILDRPSDLELPTIADEDLLTPTATNPVVVVRPGLVRLYAPKCPHGHFARWAAHHCTACNPDLAAAFTGSAATCTGTRRDGSPCTRTTTHRLAGLPACHDHGGQPATTS